MPFEVVITGASGFIGGALLKELRKIGIPVIGLSRHTKKGLTLISSYEDIDFDFLNKKILIHLAQPRDAANPSDGNEIVICKSLAAKQWQHIIYVSSSVIYGDTEEYPRMPDEVIYDANEYAQVKLACESIITNAGGTCLRFSNIYGQEMASNSVISDILSQIPGKGDLYVRDKLPVRDFLWIEDAVSCLISALVLRPGGIFNVGSGKVFSIGKIAELALLIAGEENRTVISKTDLQKKSTLVLDISKTSSILNWNPEMEIELGLSLLIKMKISNE
jgi:UDP-glucose 4-epimerase